MKKSEITGLMIRLYNCMDQAQLTDSVERLMGAAPISKQKEFIELLLGNCQLIANDPDEEDLATAIKLVGFEGEISF